jgi:hypothetical protein
MVERSHTDAELLAQYERALESERVADRTEPRARSARYDRESGRIVVELKSGAAFAVPAALLPELGGAPPAALEGVEPVSGGEGIAWEALDVHVSVPGLLAAMLGPELVRAFARRGGSSTSERKAAAARANGRRGGRPRRSGYHVEPGYGTLMVREEPRPPRERPEEPEEG